MNTRQQDIINLLEHNGEMTIKAMSEALNVSAMTIHRDLDYLEKQHFLYKKRGAAVFRQENPNTFWVMDITYIPTTKGFVYLCAVMDLCGRKVLSWRVGNNMTTTLVTDTVKDAVTKEKVTDGLALHSDQGSQYTSKEYFDLTQLYHITPSMSSPGCPYDNAAMEVLQHLTHILPHTTMSHICGSSSRLWALIPQRSLL